MIFDHMIRFPEPQKILLRIDKIGIFNPPGRVLDELLINITFVSFENLGLVDLGFSFSKFEKMLVDVRGRG